MTGHRWFSYPSRPGLTWRRGTIVHLLPPPTFVVAVHVDGHTHCVDGGRVYVAHPDEPQIRPLNTDDPLGRVGLRNGSRVRVGLSEVDPTQHIVVARPSRTRTTVHTMTGLGLAVLAGADSLARWWGVYGGG